MKRFICGILCLCLLWAVFGFAAAEEENEDPGLIDELIDEENEEIDLNSPAIYTCKLGPDRPIFRIMDSKYEAKTCWCGDSPAEWMLTCCMSDCGG